MNEIHERILNNIDNKYDKTKGSFFYDATAPVSIELENQNNKIKEVGNKFDVENLSGIELEKYINQRTGISRKQATYAATIATITGQEGSLISKGDLVSSDTVNFIIQENKTIGLSGQVNVLLECELPGSVGNVPQGSIKYFPISIPGLTSVINNNSVTNGFNAESDENLLSRYYETIRTPSTSGNKYHYMNWAKEIVGVGDARVFSLWAGDNTVKVVITDSNKQTASEELVLEVQNYIDPNTTGTGEGQAPIGAFCTVVSAIKKDINISFTVTKDINYTLEQIKTNVSNSIAEYLKSIAFKEDTVSYARIGSLILSSGGVLDYQALKVNLGTSNIQVLDTDVAILGEVVVSE
ncbi:baseplate J/gp47 family protein [Tissierella creatinophila]|uniref:Baseplate J-like protein n=1 Tax=Tissierella creatinophila DSM 6911 TaxID=1123403 RepID=A0A1U7M4J2_TISCR|nr:baseplate J/gp47 family protein [Tissierella creatinophila]OLS02233.1 baseplate J-like protein [Tissierella creatinophila DSM 6911]